MVIVVVVDAVVVIEVVAAAGRLVDRSSSVVGVTLTVCGGSDCDVVLLSRRGGEVGRASGGDVSVSLVETEVVDVVVS